jgi:hypothetical protein
VNRARSRRPPIVFILLTLMLLTFLLVAPLSVAVGATSAGSEWSIVPTANPHSPEGTFSAVSCSGASACMAVGGHYSDGAGTDVSLAERWDGTVWSIQHTPHPAGAQSSDLTAVACSAANSCIAVGWYISFNGKSKTLAERWDGTAWSIQPTPNPLGVHVSELSGVACTSSKTCTAVGDYGDGFTEATLAERWNGTAWTIQPTVSPGRDARLSAVACASSQACTAVGHYTNSVFNEVTLAERWDGTAWTKQLTPNPTGMQISYLFGVSCAEPAACTAVGYSIAGGGGVTLAERWDGTSWSIQSTPNPATSFGAGLLAVACATATACTAVGDYSNGSNSVTLAERWDGKTWSIQSTPNPGQGGTLSGVACTSASACTTVGEYETSRTNFSLGFSVTLAERWNGTSWSIQPTPNHVVARYSELNDVACPSAAACFAVGDYDTGAVEAPLAERWDGTAWSIQTIATPRHVASSILNGIACIDTTACIAVGSTQDASYSNATLVERWDGTAWTIQATPNPGQGGELSGVACTSSTACTAVGSFTNSAGKVKSLAERWDGAAWTIQPTPNPSGVDVSALSGVACTSATACTAVGDYGNGFNDLTLAERWDGTAWTIQPTPNAGKGGKLSAVACTSSTTCTAVGFYYTSKLATLVEQWNGTTWTVQPSPNPPSAGASELSEVACSTASACTAVGDYESSGGENLTLAERWNGAGWTIQPTPNPGNTGFSELSGVACPKATACMAVGFSINSAGRFVTLGERYSG